LRIVFRGSGVAFVIPVAEHCRGLNGRVSQAPGFVLICEAEFGLVAVPADRIVRITKTGEASYKTLSGCDSHDGTCEIGGRDYRFLDLNRVMEDSHFTICWLQD
jgi:hypothetical protein